jgi:hypothetical protein
MFFQLCDVLLLSIINIPTLKNMSDANNETHDKHLQVYCAIIHDFLTMDSAKYMPMKICNHKSDLSTTVF